jgi:hypothetical protein
MNERSLQIPFVPELKDVCSMMQVSDILDRCEKNAIDLLPWPKFPDKPQVSFAIAHAKDRIFIKYDVTEKELLARYKQTNEPVYKDSCVEFFIAPGEDRSYYNFEFNSLGTCLGAFGNQRNDRTLLPVEVLQTIKSEGSLKQIHINQEAAINWTLTLEIPLSVFCFHQLSSISHKKCRMNFFKCGDDLSRPQYLVWNNIISEEPDFHLPEFFGGVEFL